MKHKKNGKLLLVEDDIELRETLEEIFLLHDITHDVAENAPDAKQHILQNKHPYALVLSDYLMPGESGLDFFIFLRKQEGYREVPFYILSARTEDEVKYRCKNAGVTDFIKKPFEMQMILDVVKKHIDS